MAKQKETGSSSDSPNQPAAENLDKVIQLIHFMGQNQLSELDLEVPGLKVSLRKNSPQSVLPIQSIISAPVAASTVLPTKNEFSESATPQKIQPVENDLHKIISPMAGTFYRAPSPTLPPYVKEGDKIEIGMPVCIVEAMKLMNEIKADIGGKLVKVLVENAKPVEKGTVLFLIDTKV